MLADDRLRSLNGLDGRHSRGSRFMCFFTRGIGCRCKEARPSSSTHELLAVGPPNLPCLISSSMIFSSASCFCFFSCNFWWMFTLEPALPSFSLEPPVWDRGTGRRQKGIAISPVLVVVIPDGSLIGPEVINWMPRLGGGTKVVGFFFFRR